MRIDQLQERKILIFFGTELCVCAYMRALVLVYVCVCVYVMCVLCVF